SEYTGLPILDAMRLRRYADEAKTAMMDGARIIWGPDPANVTNRRILLVDDVLDEGYSIVRGKQLLYNDHNAAVVRTGVLDFKLGPREKHFQHLTPDYVGEIHPGAPWIQYPWERDGATHENELLMLVTMGYLKRENVDRIIELVREREAKANVDANVA
ncbi:MAG: phosphoribosyltransferase, partial [Candidatus Kerfeldbacteria bacterium]|nr:phosphoribosyltransferase [Candidatus Kerfeldbacteria bacterium]